MKLSVCLATYNEEANLTDCLASIEDLATEIVIVDGGSVDQTVTIAKKSKANIISASNPAIFHLNKKRAIEVANSPWILQLDADERVSPELKEEIRQKIKADADINGYWIPRKNYFLGKFLTKGGQYPDYTMRLYRKGKANLPCKSVHEQADVSGSVGYLKNPLIHMADPTLERYLVRFNRYTSLLAEELSRGQLKINTFSFIDFFMTKPASWFIWSFFRHRGYVDGFSGFVFAFFSSLRFPVAFIKYWEKNHAYRH